MALLHSGVLAWGSMHNINMSVFFADLIKCSTEAEAPTDSDRHLQLFWMTGALFFFPQPFWQYTEHLKLQVLERNGQFALHWLAFFTADILLCHSRKSTRINDKTNNVWIPFSCSLRVLVLFMLVYQDTSFYDKFYVLLCSCSFKLTGHLKVFTMLLSALHLNTLIC